MAIPVQLANRLGFIVLGLTNNFAYVVMLSAAFDLLHQSSVTPDSNKYCNEQSTSTILLADTIPSLTIKIIYPFLLTEISAPYKALVVAAFSAASFVITGLTVNQALIFTGVACASFSSGLGESTYLSSTPLYGDVSLSGWSMGTGGAGLLGAAAYALLRMVLPIKTIMLIMLIIPIAMLVAFFRVIQPVSSQPSSDAPTGSQLVDPPPSGQPAPELDMSSRQRLQPDLQRNAMNSNYGSRGDLIGPVDRQQPFVRMQLSDTAANEPLDLKSKLARLPSLTKYFMPLLIVYFAEYFINQGLFELIYYPEVSYLQHQDQYRWFQVTYQFGVLVSRSSLDFIKIKSIWSMSLLQCVNALLFLAHTAKLIHIPSFYLVILIIVYEGLLGGFTYVNTFYRIKSEIETEREQEFAISAVTLADTLGIVFAGLAALPVHNALCKLYM